MPLVTGATEGFSAADDADGRGIVARADDLVWSNFRNLNGIDFDQNLVRHIAARHLIVGACHHHAERGLVQQARRRVIRSPGSPRNVDPTHGRRGLRLPLISQGSRTHGRIRERDGRRIAAWTNHLVRNDDPGIDVIQRHLHNERIGFTAARLNLSNDLVFNGLSG